MAIKTYLTLAMLAGITIAAPALGVNPPTFTEDLIQRCVGEGYATFYDDNACTKNGGEAVSLANPGCLANEVGRNSIYIQAPCIGSYSMVWSPGTECNCQNDCASVPTFGDGANGCWDLNGHAYASSFRFIGSDCDSNNC